MYTLSHTLPLKMEPGTWGHQIVPPILVGFAGLMLNLECTGMEGQIPTHKSEVCVLHGI